jgi:hypothetical protein
LSLVAGVTPPCDAGALKLGRAQAAGPASDRSAVTLVDGGDDGALDTLPLATNALAHRWRCSNRTRLWECG